MRIADVLRERDDGDDGGSGDHSIFSFTSKTYFATPIATAASSPSSRSLLSRWFRNRRKRAPAASGGELIVPLSTSDGVVIEGVDSDSRLSEIDLCSGGKSNEMAFNLGLGIGMAFVLAGNTKEMNKMMELREQMEMLLKEIKGEVRRRDDSSICTASDVGLDAISTTISIQHQSSSLDMEEPKHFTESDRKNYQSGENLRGLDQLEAELQVELEQMQLNFEGEGVGQHKMVCLFAFCAWVVRTPAWWFVSCAWLFGFSPPLLCFLCCGCGFGCCLSHSFAGKSIYMAVCGRFKRRFVI